MDFYISRIKIESFLKEAKIELSDENYATLNSIFKECDIRNYKNNEKEKDELLDNEEFASFEDECKKNKNLFNKLSKFFDYIKNLKQNNNSQNTIIANNIAETSDIDLAMDLLNSKNTKDLLQIMDEIYWIDMFHQGLFKRICKEDSDISKLEIYANKIVDYAKTKGIYTKDYEDRMEYAKQKRNGYLYGIAIDRLFERISISDKETKNEKLQKVLSRRQEIKEPNGQIDEAFAQGYTGDCWLISVINSITKDKYALEKLNNMISVQKEGDKILNVTVKIQEETYVIDYEELKNANEYATGDLDVRAIEIAASRYKIEHEGDDICYGSADEYEGFSILFGEDNVDFNEYEISTCMRDFDEEELAEINKERLRYIEDIKTGNLMSIITTNADYDKKVNFINENGEEVPLNAPHEMTVLYADDKYIYAEDPHKPKQKLHMEIDKLLNCLDGAVTVTIK